MELFSKITSWVLLPLFMPIYGLLLTMYIPNFQNFNTNHDSLYLLNDVAKTAILTMFFIFGSLAPALSYFVLFRMKMIGNLEMDNKNERFIPIFLMFIYCAMLFYMLITKVPFGTLPKFIYGLPLSGAIIMVVYALINRKFKISLHAGGAGILSGYIFAYAYTMILFSFWIVLLVIIASGLVMTARLYLKKHSPLEIYTGWSIAFFITLFTNLYINLLY